MRGNYWFIPTTIIAMGIGLAYGMLEVDASLPSRYIQNLGWIYAHDAAGARALLSVTAQSVITVAGVVFSITAVALTFASNQFGTQVLKSFIHDIGNQGVLGMFLATFIYGLIVMRRLEGGVDGFVPSLSVAVGMFLGLASTFTLVYFIHHVIVSMEAETVVAKVAEDLRDTIDFLFPEDLGKDKTEAPSQNSELPADFEDCSADIYCEREGYISSIDNDKLLGLTVKHDLIVKSVRQPGDFVFEKLLLAKAWPERRATKAVCSEIRKSFHVSRQRTYEQDIRFALDQLALLATRSLSPSINALGTAMDSIDRIGAALVLVGNRRIPSANRYDEGNRLRVLTPPWELEHLASRMLGPLRNAAESYPAVMNHLRTVLGTAVAHIENESFKQALRGEMRLL